MADVIFCRARKIAVRIGFQSDPIDLTKRAFNKLLNVTEGKVSIWGHTNCSETFSGFILSTPILYRIEVRDIEIECMLP